MMFRNRPRLALALLFLSGPVVRSGDTVAHGGAEFWVHRIDPKTVKIELHLPEKAGEPNTFPKLAARLEARGRRLVFAMNAGIFEGNFRPTGLHISEGRTETKLNLDGFVETREGELTPNFFLKPNGVFYLRPDGSAAIAESHRYATLGERPVLATQSGPLLVQAGAVHPALQPGSTSRRYRNGVGVTSDGTVVFACSVLEPERGVSNLHHFAPLFRDRLGCPDALYLDGGISYVHLRGKTGPVEETNWFAGILAITEAIE